MSAYCSEARKFGSPRYQGAPMNQPPPLHSPSIAKCENAETAYGKRQAQGPGGGAHAGRASGLTVPRASKCFLVQRPSSPR